MMLYVIKAAITLALLYSCFFIFLSKETFHRFNRCMLVGIMLVSLFMPMFHFTTSHPTTLNEEVYIVQNYIEHDTPPIIVTAQQAQGITWIQALTWIYMAGVVLMLILTLVQATSLCRFMCSGVRHTDTKGNTVILHNNDVPPFSIFRYIVMSVKDYESSRQYILTHEQEHIRLGHTYDLLLLQGMKTLMWFNPFIWFLSRDLKAVHEYEADQAVINQGIDAKSYQQLLVMKVVGNRLQPFTNNLNHGSLKKRIVMMYQKPSNRWLMLKALCAIPVAALTINTFATPIETDPVEDMVKTLETTNVPAFNEVKETLLPPTEETAEAVIDDNAPFAIHPVKDQHGRIIGFSHEGEPAAGDFACTAEYVFIDGRQATEAELRNYKTLLANSTFEMLKTEKGTAKYNYKDKHGIIVIHTQDASAAPDDNEPLVLVNDVEINLPVDIKTITNETIAEALGIQKDDIEGITVLIDNAATTIFGERGKNGVVDIKVVKSAFLNRLPGIQKNEDGTYSINGRKVQKILVNGKEFFKALSDDQEIPTIQNAIHDDPIFEVTEEPAQYPGGQAALMQYIAQNIRYPKISAENGVQGRVLVQFVIEKDGSLSNFKIVKDAKPVSDGITVNAQGTTAEGNDIPKEAYGALNIEALRVLRGMPNWTPAKQRGQVVRMRYTLPVTFRLE
ncbi:MAG: M56 family metallopeptidase [Bacteroidaceae bacterium]|nr:M56 family metallopeptidase [Bacteroidaceae bacterium]